MKMKITQKERIEKMEEILNKSEKLTRNVEKILDEFQANEKEYYELIKYYYAEDWEKDKDDFERGQITGVKSAGVLTEDAIWDLMSDNNELAIRFLEIATKLLKK